MRTEAQVKKTVREVFNVPKSKCKIYVFKVDVDKQKKLAGALGIQSMPTIFFIPKDDKPQVIVGAADKATFHRAVKQVLLKEGK